MEYLARLVTESFTKKIPAGKNRLNTGDLKELGIPGFVIRLIERRVREILGDAVLAEGRDWIDVDHKVVAEAGQHFAGSVIAYLRIPAARIPEVVQPAVEEALAMLVRPREIIPERIFGNNTVLTVDELEEHTARVPVYKHLATAPVKYVHRKKLSELSIDQCRKVIAMVDEKLIATYEARDWVQLVEPIYQLAGDNVNPALLKLFFEEKGVAAQAKKFAETDHPVNRSQLTEILSSGEGSGLRDAETAYIPDTFGTTEPIGSRGTVENNMSVHSPGAGDSVANEPGLVDSGHDIVGSEPDTIAPDDEAPPIWKQFAPDVEEEEEEEEEEVVSWFGTGSEEPDSDSLPGAGAGSQNDSDFADQTGYSPETDPDENDLEEDAGQSLHSFWNEVESQPSLPDDPDEQSSLFDSVAWEPLRKESVGKETGRGETAGINPSFPAESVKPDTGQNSGSDSQEALIIRFGREKEYYIKELFQGSEQAFNSAMIDLAAFSNWKDASRYIEEEIFIRNHVDIFTDSAVGFTDHLQSYFSARISG